MRKKLKKAKRGSKVGGENTGVQSNMIKNIKRESKETTSVPVQRGMLKGEKKIEGECELRQKKKPLGGKKGPPP